MVSVSLSEFCPAPATLASTSPYLRVQHYYLRISFGPNLTHPVFSCLRLLADVAGLPYSVAETPSTPSECPQFIRIFYVLVVGF